MNVTQDYRRTKIVAPKKLLGGLDAAVDSIAGSQRSGHGVAQIYLRRAQQIDLEAAKWASLGDKVLETRLAEFRAIFIRRQRGYLENLPSAMAAVREAAGRKAGLRPYVVQVAGALALYDGCATEMATGEGKTLTAATTSVLNAWSGWPCHVITVNDYLARRDAEWFEPLYKYCGVSSGCVTGDMDSRERREQYGNDLVITTSKEIVADFLRDRIHLGNLQNPGRRLISLMLGQEQAIDRGLVMRGIHTAIVDEADSILVDEAVTPLIISRAQPNDPFIEACRVTNDLADRLRPGAHYKIDWKYKDIELGSSLQEEIDAVSQTLTGFSKGLALRADLLKQAITAREFYRKDREYVIQDGKVVIVDEFTGRLMPQRTWRSGLHQFIEAKEGIEVTPPSETLARLSFQRFFRFFKKLSGMTGTAEEAAPEFWQIYHLPTVAIPLNEKCIRQVHPQLIYADEESKWNGIFKDIVLHHMQRRPILVGTRSVDASEKLAATLTRAGLPFRLLNAVHHKEEAHIIARAGEMSTITIATNMAGRGTDIRLQAGVDHLGGLHVIGTECHESHRIDRQLYGRCARQGDPGTSRSFVSFEDELMKRYLPESVRKVATKVLAREPEAGRLLGVKLVKIAQGRAEQLAYRRRRSVLKMDTWLDDSLSFAHADVM